MLKMVSHSKSAMSENARNVHEMEMREALCFCSDKIKKMSFEGNFFFFFSSRFGFCCIESVCIHRNIYATAKPTEHKKSHNPTRWIRLMNTIKCYLKHGNSRAIERSSYEKPLQLTFSHCHLFLLGANIQAQFTTHTQSSICPCKMGSTLILWRIFEQNQFFVAFFFIYSAIYFQWLRVSLSYAENCLANVLNRTNSAIVFQLQFVSSEVHVAAANPYGWF